MPRHTAIAAALLVACAAGAGEAPPAAHHPETAKKMRMDEPMSTQMMKKGMKKGDVRKNAARKAADMQPMMDMEEKSMPPPASKP